MTKRTYKNPNASSQIASITCGSIMPGYPFDDVPKVQLLAKFMANILPIKLVSFSDQESYYVEVEGYPISRLKPFLGLLESHGYIDGKFREQILNAEFELYQQQMNEKHRRIYVVQPPSLIDAVILQEHHTPSSVLIRYQEQNENALHSVLKKEGVDSDKMSNEFEQLGIISSKQTPLGELESLQKAGLITEAFKNEILTQEKKIAKTLPRTAKIICIETVTQHIETFSDLVNDHCVRTKAISHGFLQGQQPRHLREILKALSEVKKNYSNVVPVVEKIVASATRMGTQHPILHAARKLQGLAIEFNQQNSKQLSI